MSLLETLKFAFGLMGRSIDFASVVWAIIAFLVGFFVTGMFWGKAWNRSWGILNHLGSALLNLLFGLALAAAVVAWLGADRTTSWLEEQRDLVSRQASSSGALNRDAFRDAWDKLYPLGGQNDLAPPVEGGNELRLNSDRDARIVAESAATAAKKPLLNSGPFALGATVHVRDPQLVAQDVMSVVTTPNYPIIVPSENAWSKAAIIDQVKTAFDAASENLRQPMRNLKIATTVLIALLLVIQLVLTPLNALNDIKASPKV